MKDDRSDQLAALLGHIEVKESKIIQASAQVPAAHMDTLKFPHELKVHQIELDMQNDELRLAKTEEELRRVNTILTDALIVSRMAWWEMDCRTGETRFHPQKAIMLGFPPEQFNHYRDFTSLLHPDDVENAMNAMRAHLNGEKDAYEVDYRIRTATGSYKWFQDIGRITTRDPEGKPLIVTGIAKDFTERKINEIEMLRLYKQNRQESIAKTDLLNEVNHRVKNNLMMILGLVLAEKRRVHGDTTVNLAEMWDNFELRLGGMLKVHQMLSDSGWMPMKINTLASQICFGVLESFGMTARVELLIDPCSISISPRQSNNLALVFNELMTNSLKYAFRQTENPSVAISVRRVGDDAHIEFRDNGSGYPPDFLAHGSQQVGLRLVQQLVEETLDGTVHLSNRSGAVIELSMRIEDSV